MAEPAIAIDSADPSHLVAAADPYLNPVRILVSESHDGGRSWDRPIEIVPPGFDKAYDPSVAVVDDEVVVVGGASREGALHCQPGSAIFVARIRARRISYSLIQSPSGSVYVDRPRMIADAGSGALFVTWTRSTGLGAECLAAPTQSSTFFARSRGDGSFASPVRLASPPSSAPFGSSIAVSSDGATVYVVVRERNPSSADRIVVTSSFDGGRTFERRDVIASAPAYPASIPGVGGFIADVPAITADGARSVTVAWSDSQGGGSTIRLARSVAGGAWRRMRPLGGSADYAFLPNVAYDGGNLWLVYAAYSSGDLSFVARRRTQRWSSVRRVASGPAGGYAEIGQSLGLAAAGGRVAIAVPVDGPTSRLRVWTLTAAGSATTQEPDPDLPAESGGGREEGGDTDLRVVLVVVGMTAAVCATFAARRLLYRRGTRPDTTPASDTTDA